ncbi:MAG TPA: LysR family transcriptional regulator [Acetobacteraceae bacterium]|jgi:DNA-binding transcriptional LysR family regulator
MDRLDAMAAFVAAVDDGSLAAAARRLRHSPASVTRAIAALEDRLGMQLLHRSTRALRLTRFGETYLATCRQVLADLDAAERGAAAEQEAPRGLLTLTAPVLFGRLRLRPVLDRFLDANPAVQARLLLLDRVVNLVDEGIDVATRLAHLPDSGLVATRLGDVRRVLCASPGYLARHGTPRTPADLVRHACIMSSETAGEDPWRFAPEPGGRRRISQPIAVRSRLMVNGAAPAIDSALEDCGITRVLSYQIESDVAAGRLILLLTAHEPPPIPVHFVLPPARSATAKLRAFIDFAAPLLRADLARTARVIGMPGADSQSGPPARGIRTAR